MEGLVATAEKLETRACPTCGEKFPADFAVCPRDATPLEAGPKEGDPWIGRVLKGTYRIVRPLSEGGMGRIFAASHLRLPDRQVAVKVLGEEWIRDAEVVARFEREVASASRVVHPHVIEVYDAGRTENGVNFLVTELLEGEDLGARLERTNRPIPVELAATLGRQTCLALAAAHARGVIHRDVKPENVFLIEVDGAPFVKVLDFGISKLVHGGEDAKLTRMGAVLGTPAYMSPEQARGGEVDARTDVYGVGATLYTALTNRAPFEAEDAAAALSKLLDEEPPRLRSLAPSVPPELEVVVQRAMAKNPRDRYASALDLAAALAPFDRDADLPHATTVVQSQPEPESPRGARIAVLFYAILLGVFWIAGASTAAAALVRAARHAKAVTATESFLVLAAVGLATFLLSASVLGRTREAWPNSMRILRLLRERRRILVLALSVYALGCLGVRFAVTFVLAGGEARGLELWFDVIVFAASMMVALVVAGVAWASRRIARMRRR
jgi:serine/threonine protein kinase